MLVMLITLGGGRQSLVRLEEGIIRSARVTRGVLSVGLPSSCALIVARNIKSML